MSTNRRASKGRKTWLCKKTAYWRKVDHTEKSSKKQIWKQSIWILPAEWNKQSFLCIYVYIKIFRTLTKSVTEDDGVVFVYRRRVKGRKKAERKQVGLLVLLIIR